MSAELRTPQDNYNYIRNQSVPLEERWPNPPLVVIPLLQRLRSLGVILVADAPRWDRVSIDGPRMGLAVIEPGNATMIWINIARHYIPNTNRLSSSNKVIELELIDTITHEAIHTTGVDLGRFEIQPLDTSTDAYKAEEVCAFSGTSAIHQRMGHEFAAMQNKRAAQKEASRLSNTSLRGPAIEQGHEAARYLMLPNT